MISPQDYIEQRLNDQINWYDRKITATTTPKPPIAILVGNEFLAKPDRNGIVVAATISLRRRPLNQHCSSLRIAT
jgi:hypothetical protein